ncbi:OLC1v1023639C1 [Oldenlandia corymbosa var. corymbosa]|uniref:OLC1v1023639C1 n=1 Tax=Oldenlandia corymbosa var. corymbosa TaxID=529605 RepID=A0AAV1C2U6_OLDCO|nr:OLC1v1023639C1 [Oldenlandia corymbosa var. corymbosa]
MAGHKERLAGLEKLSSEQMERLTEAEVALRGLQDEAEDDIAHISLELEQENAANRGLRSTLNDKDAKIVGLKSKVGELNTKLEDLVRQVGVMIVAIANQPLGGGNGATRGVTRKKHKAPQPAKCCQMVAWPDGGNQSSSGDRGDVGLAKDIVQVEGLVDYHVGTKKDARPTNSGAPKSGGNNAAKSGGDRAPAQSTGGSGGQGSSWGSSGGQNDGWRASSSAQAECPKKKIINALLVNDAESQHGDLVAEAQAEEEEDAGEDAMGALSFCYAMSPVEKALTKGVS